MIRKNSTADEVYNKLIEKINLPKSTAEYFYLFEIAEYNFGKGKCIRVIKSKEREKNCNYFIRRIFRKETASSRISSPPVRAELQYSDGHLLNPTKMVILNVHRERFSRNGRNGEIVHILGSRRSRRKKSYSR